MENQDQNKIVVREVIPQLDENGRLVAGNVVDPVPPVQEEPPIVPDDVNPNPDEVNLGEEEGELDDIFGDQWEGDDTIPEEDIYDLEELPDHIRSYIEFYEETGGSIEDFQRINRGYDGLPENQVIADYLKTRNPNLDDSDIQFIIQDEYSFDEDMDSESDIQKKKIARKRLHGEALGYFNDQKEKYKAELGSSAASPEAKEALEFYRTYQEQESSRQELIQKQRQAFVGDSRKLFNGQFEGFEIKVGDKVAKYKPKDLRSTVEHGLEVNKFVQRFTDEQGNVTDVAGWHKAIAAAMDPDGLAEYFFEMGKAAALEEEARDSRNVSQGIRQTKQPVANQGPGIRDVEVNQRTGTAAPIKLRNY